MLHNINIERHTRFNLQTTATFTNTKQQNKQNMHRYDSYDWRLVWDLLCLILLLLHGISSSRPSRTLACCDSVWSDNEGHAN